MCALCASVRHVALLTAAAADSVAAKFRACLVPDRPMQLHVAGVGSVTRIDPVETVCTTGWPVLR